MLDAHCHIHFEAFDGADPVGESRDAGLTGLVVADYDSTRRDRLRQLQRDRGVWACCGFHPWAVEEDASRNDAELKAVTDALEDDVWVAVGEFGLDRSGRRESTFDEQCRVARRLLGMARDADLPVVLHVVSAHEAMLELLRIEGPLDAGGICHGFTGTPEQAKRYLDLGLSISIGTNAVRGNVGRVREVCRAIPRASMTVETDSPSRPPDGVDAPNHPRYLSRVIEAVAGFVEEEASTLADVTETNARRIFRLGDENL